MELEAVIKIRDKKPKSHCFIYKDKQYPIDFDYFKRASDYFFRNKKELKKIKIIPLIDPKEEEKLKLDIPEEMIEQFIKYVEHQSIRLNSENITYLSYLAKKYEVSSLIESINEFIKEHQPEFSLQILIENQNENNFDTNVYEESICHHMNDFIKNDQIFQLNFPIFYRIVSKYQNLNEDEITNKINDEEMNEFLFKCLDKYGIKILIIRIITVF